LCNENDNMCVLMKIILLLLMCNVYNNIINVNNDNEIMIMCNEIMKYY